jgi:predicted AlkP superfamily phosphohydrolase/phosphomutase
MTKILIFGLDGATFDLIRPWAEEGKLPTLQRLMCQGTWGPLESTVPPMTSPAWPSFATGKYPAQHGVFDFVSAHSGTFNIVNATGVKAQPLWDILSAQGRHVGVMNVPVTYPPHPVNGFMISGLLSPSTAQVTYPDDLLERYEHGSKYRVMPSIQYKPGNEHQFLQDLESLADTRALFASRLMRDRPWDFLMVHFLAVDLAQHALWRYMDPAHPQHVPDNPFQHAIQRIYQRVDRAMGKLLQQVDDETTVIVMSDHGFGPLHGVVNLNILLWEQGLLHFKRTPWTRLRAALFHRGLTPKAIYDWLVRFNLQDIVARVGKSTRNAVYNKFLSFDDVDWDRTIAYSLGHMGQIYVNVEGRERRGIVARGAAYEEAVERVVAALDTLTLPDGQRMVERVIRASELPGGKYADEGPDLHVVLDGYRYISCPLFATDGSVLSKQMHGVFVAAGPGIQAGTRTENARIVDLAPTVLYLMGCPVPDDMDGRVLTDVITPRFLEQHAPPLQATGCYAAPAAVSLSAGEESELRLRLKGLGYLD